MADREQQVVALPGFCYCDDLGGLVPSEMRVAIRAYGNARAAAARREALEEAARVCDEIGIRHQKAWKQSYDPQDQGISDGAGDCAAAVRALQDKPQADNI